jgi:branched-chain amino acid transport system ATP-binding protein
VAALRDWGVEAIVGVEHVLSAVRDLADRMIALDFGRVVAEGSPDHVLEHEAVVNSYLGAPAAAEDEAAPDRGVAPPARMADAPAAMEVGDLIAGYGEVRVLRDISMKLAPGEFIGVLGASGAGKTTLCRAVTGGCTVHGGSVTFEDADITGRPSHLVAQMGVAHVPSSRELFPDLSVEDNLRLGAVAWSGATTTRQFGRVLDLFPEVKPLMGRKAGSLSGGQQQMVAIGRALMHEPKLLVLDEPSTGLAPIVVRRLMQALRSLTEEGVAVMVVEQNAVETLRVVERAYVLQEGRLAFSGTADQLRGDPRLARAYLGSDTNAAASGERKPDSTPQVSDRSGDVTGAPRQQPRIP